MNHPTGRRSAYDTALTDLRDELAENLGHIRAEQDAGRITVAAAAAERAGLLERHLEHLAQLRREHLGGTS